MDKEKTVKIHKQTKIIGICRRFRSIEFMVAADFYVTACLLMKT